MSNREGSHDHTPGVIYHLGGMLSVPCDADPGAALRANALGTYRVLEAPREQIKMVNYLLAGVKPVATFPPELVTAVSLLIDTSSVENDRTCFGCARHGASLNIFADDRDDDLATALVGCQGNRIFIEAPKKA